MIIGKWSHSIECLVAIVFFLFRSTYAYFLGLNTNYEVIQQSEAYG